MAKINKKQMDELKKTVNEYCGQTGDIVNRLITEFNRIGDIYRDRINSLVIRDKYNREHIKALNFLNWFDWGKLYSQTLVKEAKNKLLKDLYYSQTDAVFGDVNQINKDDNTIDIEYINTGKHKVKNNVVTSHGSLYCVNTNGTLSTCVSSDYITSSCCSHKEEEPKYSYNDYVKAVVNAPYKFSKETVYKVYKYLLEVIDKDKITSKYSN